MNTLAEKLADAWIKRDLIDVKSDEYPKNGEDRIRNTRKISLFMAKEKKHWAGK